MALEGGVKSLFLHRGDVGSGGHTLFRENTQEVHLACLVEFQRLAGVSERDVHMPAEEGRVDLSATVEDDEVELDAGRLLDQMGTDGSDPPS